ncbi:unnamed protein product [Phytophthora fragariaefolia]|uniref:Unnamed protein product n=1 Tax=Phytophthora fragariaefolia TaxID=1490495 RepID=A0A9W7D4P0_9STRA|nr:unnamed protein product [Phytophthora fragariaefolia]
MVVVSSTNAASGTPSKGGSATPSVSSAPPARNDGRSSSDDSQEEEAECQPHGSKESAQEFRGEARAGQHPLPVRLKATGPPDVWDGVPSPEGGCQLEPDQAQGGGGRRRRNGGQAARRSPAAQARPANTEATGFGVPAAGFGAAMAASAANSSGLLSTSTRGVAGVSVTATSTGISGKLSIRATDRAVWEMSAVVTAWCGQAVKS